MAISAGSPTDASTLTGTQILDEIMKLGKAAKGYSETTDGGTGPQYYDCSGLVQTALHDLGVSGMPRDTSEQWSWLQSQGTAHTGTPSASQLTPGDLVYATFAGDNMVPGHVGVYAGGGQMYSAQDQSLGIGLASLASWESGGTINGWATVPNSTTSPNTPSSGGASAPASYSTLGVGNLLSQASGLTRDVATVLDYIFGMFGKGQGWRIAFVLVFAVFGILAVTTFAKSTGISFPEIKAVPV